LRRRSVALVLAILCIPAATSATTFPSQGWGEINPEEWRLAAPTAYPRADALVIFDKGFATAELSGLELKRHVRIKILAESGIPKVTPAVIECKVYDEIDDVEAVIYRPDGAIVEIGEEHQLERKDDSERSLTIGFPGLAPGDILEYRYTIHYYGGVDKLGAEKYFLFSQAISWQWLKEKEKRVVEWDESLYKNVANLPAWYFDHPVYTLYSEFTVKLGADLDYTCVPSNVPVDQQQPNSQRGSGLIDRVYKYHTWVMDDLPATESEPFMPRPNDYRPSLHFELFSTSGENRVIIGKYSEEHWVNVGRNIQGYLAMYVKKPRRLQTEALDQIRNLTTDHDRVRRLYEYVRDRYRSDGGGYRLRPVEKNMRDFHKKKRGAPFECNILLVEMLRAAGFDAWPVLISTRDEVDFRRTARFNHMIAYAQLDVGGIYLDASSGACPYGALPPMCRVQEGLLVDFDRSAIRIIQTQDPATYRHDSLTIHLSDKGGPTGSLVSRLSGYLAMEWGEYLARASAGHRDSAVPVFASDFAGMSKLKWHGDSANLYVIEAALAGDRLAPRRPGELTALVPPLFTTNPFAATVRLQPVDFVYPLAYECKVVVGRGDRADSASLPDDLTFGIAGAAFRRHSEAIGSSAVVTINIDLQKAEYTAAEYTALRDFFERVAEACRQPLDLGL